MLVFLMSFLISAESEQGSGGRPSCCRLLVAESVMFTVVPFLITDVASVLQLSKNPSRQSSLKMADSNS